jgi:hypothetical protein
MGNFVGWFRDNHIWMANVYFGQICCEYERWLEMVEVRDTGRGFWLPALGVSVFCHILRLLRCVWSYWLHGVCPSLNVKKLVVKWIRLIQQCLLCSLPKNTVKSWLGPIGSSSESRFVYPPSPQNQVLYKPITLYQILTLRDWEISRRKWFQIWKWQDMYV